MATTIGFSHEGGRRAAQPAWRRRTARRVLLAGGIVASAYYAAITAYVAAQWPGYSSASQVISELSAIGAPTRRLWSLLGIPYTLLLLGFGLGVWLSAGRRRALRVAGGAILASAALGVVGWPFAPMHMRETLAAGGGTVSDTMHLVISGITVFLMVVTIVSAARALGPGFRRYSIASLVILLAFGFLTSLDAPRVSANQPTPWIGVWERINIGVFMLWEAVLAVMLLREHRPVPGGAT